ncbi:MAG: putative stress-induced protein [Pelotomaculum thermopropionicum]|uniref:Putative stress-induced protein n=1 Tax=Pelotomaculum thermopropionicum TaxID=110500 RepID=A0A117M495_9FIRM|nr:MAG: putative stress-induced protein [Pelotomaculum thermopropionicum]
MLKSMTGYGRGEAVMPEKKFMFELKSVNHRYCEVFLRMPRYLSPLEDRIRRQIQSRIARGRVDGFLTVEECGAKNTLVKVDKSLAEAYYKSIKELQETLEVEGKIKLKHLINLPDVLTVEEPVENFEEMWPAVKVAVENALDNLVRMRRLEGERLADDFLKKVERVASLNVQIKNRAPVLVEIYRDKLAYRLKEFLEEGVLENERIAAEAAFFAERSAIDEETVRLESHLNQVNDCLEADEPTGRKLEFIIQEMNREINTVASKAGDLEISRWVIEVKSELEKLREQAQNIE